jgi:hypothetical protein
VRPKYSLKWLFIAVTAAAIAVAAIVYASEGWTFFSDAAIMACTTLAAMSVAFYGRKAPFSIGFAVAVLVAYQVSFPHYQAFNAAINAARPYLHPVSDFNDNWHPIVHESMRSRPTLPCWQPAFSSAGSAR